MLTLPPEEMLRGWLIPEEQRAPSGNLSPSSDILAPLRHVQLKVAGAPRKKESLLGAVGMETGTLWHQFFERIFKRRRLPVMLEVRLNGYLPEGWAGIADWIMWSDEYQAFVLGDLKTVRKSSSVGFLRRDGIKEAHMWQLSAYWYALERMGLPLVKAFLVMYLPLDDSEPDVQEPLMLEGRPLDRDLVIGTMEERNRLVREYLAEIDAERARWAQETGEHPMSYPTDDDILNSKLAPVQERVQKALWDGTKFQYDVKLAPHWSAAYCPYPDELCDCSTQKTNKIGHWMTTPDGEIVYVARKEYESITPVDLTPGQLNKMREEIKRARSSSNE